MRICNWKRFLTFITLVILFIILILSIINQKERPYVDVIDYQVEAGDTLWEISSKYRPDDMSIQEYIYNLKKFNDIGSIIYPKQTIHILIYKEV